MKRTRLLLAMVLLLFAACRAQLSEPLPTLVPPTVAPPTPLPPTPFLATKWGVPGDYLLVTGEIDVVTRWARLNPMYILSLETGVPEPTPGECTIRLLGTGDAILADYPFAPVPWIDGDPSLRAIMQWVPWVVGTELVAVISGTTELASVPVSPHVPSVAVLSPNGGETLSGSSATVTWEAADQDGGNLEYLVEYSADDGETWQVVFQIPNTTMCTADLASLPGTTRGRFRVTVSDGINTAWDVSDAPFTVENKRPRPQIQSPGSGLTILPQDTAVLRGLAYDVEDGTLPPEALAWSSDLSGTLGTGRELWVSPWSAGEHTITLTATDSDGLTGTATTTLTVLAEADGDGMPDYWEIAHGLDPQRDDSAEDPDGDSLRNMDEYLLGTLPNNADMDGDGFDDALELVMDSDPAVPSQGSQVTLRFSGEIRYAAGHWRSFDKPAMAMLPGHYLLNFDSYSSELDVEGTDLERTVVILRLVDPQGRGVAGGSAEYNDEGVWQALPHRTDAKGALVCVFPGLHTSMTFRMTRGGASEQRTQDVAADSYVVFQTR